VVQPHVRLTLEALEGRITPSSPRLGPEFEIAFSGVSGADPAIAVNAAGYSIVVGNNRQQGSSGAFGAFLLMGQIYDPQHNPVGGPFHVNTDNAVEQIYYFPKVTSDEAGNFDIVWAKQIPGGPELTAYLFFRSFTPQGNALGDQVQLSATNLGAYNGAHSLTTDQAGDLVLVWGSGSARDTNNNGFYLMRLDPQGNPLTNPKRFSLASSGGTVASSPDGHSVFVWNDTGRVMAQYFFESGDPMGSPFVVSPTLSEQGRSDVAADGENRFIIVWQQFRAMGSDLFGQRFDSVGRALGNPFQVNVPGGYDGYSNAVAADAQGNFTVAWEISELAGQGRYAS
jgi:hypothetical protein